ncbi:MAG TPA: peptidylprolyl isomerase [Patescibacteria group bacterium]|nr:peptidylprolyl isomerase [Patescibacteria group bacterium]
MAAPKSKPKTRKSAKSAKESLFRERLKAEAAVFTAAPKPTPVEDNLPPQLKRWREILLREINESNKPPPSAPLTAEPDTASAVPIELKARLRAKKSKRRRFIWLPLTAIITYAAFPLLRLDLYLPQVAAHLPWPAAYINGEIIWLDELKSETELVKKLQVESEAQRLALNHIIEERIVSAQFKQHNLSLPTNLLSQEMFRLVSEFGTTEAFYNYLKTNYGISAEVFARKVLAPSWRRQTLFQYLNQDPKASAERWHQAESLRQKIQAPELSFEQAAEQFSDDKLSAPQGGSLGWFTWGSMAPEFETTLRNLAVGEISQPVRTSFGYHLIRLDELNGAIPTNGASAEAGSVRASHIFMAVVDFDSWLAEKKAESRLVILVPLES